MKKDMNLQSLTAVLNLIALIGGGAFMFNSKTDGARYDDRPITEKVATVEGDVKVLKSEAGTMKEDIKEIKDDVKELLRAIKPDDYRPAIKDSKVPLVKGVAKDGTPLNAHD